MFEYTQFPFYYGASEPGPGDELLDYSQLDTRDPLESQSHSAITVDLVSRPATGQVDAVSSSHQSSPGHPLGEISSSKEERTSRSNKATDVLILRLAAEMKDELANMERRLNNLERKTESLADLLNSLSDLPGRVDRRIDNLADTVNKESQRVSKIVATVDFITRRFGPLLGRLARRPSSSWPVSSRETSTPGREEGVPVQEDQVQNSVLPLIKERRRRMNDLTKKLNGLIKRVVTATTPIGGGSIHFVDVDPYFDGHRFCEEGVSEPSYRNSDIWFYPFEYSTGGTLNISAVPSNTTNCTYIWENEGDAGDYFNCELKNALAADNITIDLSSMSNNVAGNDSLGVLSSGSASLPAFLARIFHPTINGMTAYKQAILDVYHGSL